MPIKQLLDRMRETREDSLTKGSSLLEEAHKIYLKWFYWSALFGEVFHGNEWESYTARLWMESTRITESSFVLAIHGEYKPATQILRDWLEGMIGGIYFDLYPEEGKYWEKGRQIDFGKSIKAITQKKIINDQLRKRVGQLWGLLSEYVHQKEEVGDFVASGGQPFAIYNERTLQIWLEFLRRTFDVCNSLLVSRFPQLLKAEDIEKVME